MNRHALLLAPLALLLTGCPVGEQPSTTESYDVVRVKGSIDCKGKTYNDGKVTELRIIKTNDITIRRCKINGSIRVAGLGLNGEAKGVRESSRSEGHTERAQAAAPTRVTLESLTITGHGRIPVYLAPGVTKVTLQDSTLTGSSNAVALYLDAESGHNVIRDNAFNVATGGSREVIAIDGSADNVISGNDIRRAKHGGIYLYRNCGEGGTVRHQTPQRNRITGNSFDLDGLAWTEYGIWLGSRNGGRFYCSDDDGYAFGSSKDNRDFANDNRVSGNTFTGSSRTIKNNGEGNQID